MNIRTGGRAERRERGGEEKRERITRGVNINEVLLCACCLLFEWSNSFVCPGD